MLVAALTEGRYEDEDGDGGGDGGFDSAGMLRALVAAFTAACWGGSGYSLSSLWRARPLLNGGNVPVGPPAGRPHPAAVRAGLARRGFRLTGGLAEGVARVLQVVQALGMDRAWVVMVRWALLADELGRGGGHSAVEVLGASQRPGVGVRAEDEPLVADLDAAGLRAWAGAGPLGGAGPGGGAPGGGGASPGGGGAPGGAQRWGGGVRGPGPGVPGLGAAVPAGPGAHGVYVPRGDGPADHLAGRALRTFPGAFTVAAHLAQVSPGGPPGGALWWAGQRVTAAQFAGVVGRLPGYREARALNGGQPPVLVLVICEAAAAGARSFAAAVDRLYPGPVVAATSALLQPGRW